MLLASSYLRCFATKLRMWRPTWHTERESSPMGQNGVIWYAALDTNPTRRLPIACRRSRKVTRPRTSRRHLLWRSGGTITVAPSASRTILCGEEARTCFAHFAKRRGILYRYSFKRLNRCADLSHVESLLLLRTRPGPNCLRDRPILWLVGWLRRVARSHFGYPAPAHSHMVRCYCQRAGRAAAGYRDGPAGDLPSVPTRWI